MRSKEVTSVVLMWGFWTWRGDVGEVWDTVMKDKGFWLLKERRVSMGAGWGGGERTQSWGERERASVRRR